MLPDGGRVPTGHGSIPFDRQSAPRRRLAPPALRRHAGMRDPRRPASLMHCCEPDGWRASREARAIGWEEDVDLDGNPPSVAVLRADRAGGHTKTPRSRRALKLAQMAAGALREWQMEQAGEREPAGSHWHQSDPSSGQTLLSVLSWLPRMPVRTESAVLWAGWACETERLLRLASGIS
jgi:hypothetical protein